jgi:hypothetical protein
MNSSKKLSARSKKNNSIKSFKEMDQFSSRQRSKESDGDIQIIPLRTLAKKKTEEHQEEDEPLSIEGPPHILSNDVSDIYRVINSDIQYRKSHRQSGKEIENIPEEMPPLVTIETNNLEKNKKEYMKKIVTRNSKNKFQKDLKELHFEDDLEKDGDMQKMKDHVKKLQAIRVEKQMSGVDSQKEIPKKSKPNVKGTGLIQRRGNRECGECEDRTGDSGGEEEGPGEFATIVHGKRFYS